MVMTYEQCNIILGVIDQEVNLSKDNVIERIKELLKEVKILGQAETSRMLEEISHGLEVSGESTRDTRAIKKETKGGKCTADKRRSKKDTKGVKGIKCATDGKKNAKKVRCTRDIRRIKSSGARGCAKCTRDLRKGTSDARYTKDTRNTK
ncbi:hypothetical protein [Wolbachia endosymbiont (group B) of Melanostoma mellinum]|uniref:hypothetical protein n=1 Tax=Wolbachia endosymbiont (group B) of Melanostoma mellinum TaxID=2954030 RepID=UPI00222F9DE1|nr:hypothetical protein [Wolbachia endosymbiont (group B) of Melanostoma mellinum]